jgi:NAD(P)H-flavin reductase
MVSYGTEVIVGVKRDPTFGPVMLFGAGGNLAELIADKNLHLLPVGYASARELVEQSKVFPLLNGYRGEPPEALEKLYELIVRLGKLIENTPDVEEIEINPVIVTLNHAWAVDGKVILKQGIVRPVRAPLFKVAAAVECLPLGGNFHSFTFESETPVVFKPGQYINIKVANTRINCYSICSQKDEKTFSLLIDTSPGGPGSKFFENLRVGDKITYLGPFGVFTFKPDDGAKHVIFMATGSGLSPINCIINEELTVKKSTAQMTLYFGQRFHTDLFWVDYYKELSRKYPNFTFKPVLSKPDNTWKAVITLMQKTAPYIFAAPRE